MTNHIIDNTLKNLNKTVLWQYDKAYRLLAILKHFQMTYHIAVTRFWDFWLNRVLSIDSCNDLGASVWGLFLGVPRPTVKDSDGGEHLVATSVYRRLLKGAFYLMKASGSFESILGYLEIVFGVMGEDTLSPWTLSVSEFGWRAELDDPIAKKTYKYAEGEMEDVVDNPSLTGDMIYLRLYDVEGNLRKLGGAASDSLSVSCSFLLGDTTITATATRRRKCGITMVDNQDMSITYGRSQYYSEMHKDQMALFEQKAEELIPYPLGIRTNDPPPYYVFGFGPDYLPDKDAKGDIITDDKGRPQYTIRGRVAVWYDKDTGYSENTIILARASDVIKFHSTPVSWMAMYYRRLIYVFQVYKTATVDDNKNGYDFLSGRYPNLPRPEDEFETSEYAKYIGIFSQDGQQEYVYEPNVGIRRRFTFGHYGADGIGYNYYSEKEISAEENTSFDAIKSRLKKTMWGRPFTSSFAEGKEPYFDYRKCNYYNKAAMSWYSSKRWDELGGDSASTTIMGQSSADKEAAAKAAVIAVIKKGRLFCANIDGFIRIYKMNQDISILDNSVLRKTDNEESDDDMTFSLLGLSGRLFLSPDSSPESVLSRLGQYAIKYSLPEIPYSTVRSLQLNTLYEQGDIITYEGQMYAIEIPDAEDEDEDVPTVMFSSFDNVKKYLGPISQTVIFGYGRGDTALAATSPGRSEEYYKQ